MKSGLALPMDKYYAEYKWDDRFLPVALSFSKQYPGGRFGVPYTFHGEAIYYNNALFEKAGITSEPKTYDELVAAARSSRRPEFLPLPSAERSTGTSCASWTKSWRPSAAPRSTTRS